MPETIGLAIISLASASAGAPLVLTGSASALGLATAAGTTISVAGFAVSAAAIGQLAIAGVSIGAQLALGSQKPKLKPQDVQNTLRQSIGPRVVHFGTVMAGGSFAFWEARNGVFHHVIVNGHGKASRVIFEWFGDTQLTVEPSGKVAVRPWGVPGRSAVVLKTSNGTAPANYTDLEAAFPGIWTADHKLLGVTSTYLQLIDEGPKSFPKSFQGGIPQHRKLAEWQEVYDSRTGLTAWSDNAALCILHVLLSPDFFNIPLSQINLPSWSAFADLCDEPVPRLIGGTERRYRLSGSATMAEPRKAVLQRMFDTCDGRIAFDRFGKVGVTGGRYIAPDVTLDDVAIIENNTSLWAGPNERFTHVVPTFTSPSHDYQTIDAAPWIDELREAAEGRQSTTLDLVMVPSHTQAQRLAKIAGRRAGARYRADIRTNLAGINAWQERTVRITDSEFGTDKVCEIKSCTFEFTATGAGLTLSVAECSPEFWAWDPATEEGPAPPVPLSTSTLDTIETPMSVVVSVEPVVINAVTTGARLKVTWAVPVRSGRGARIEYRRQISPGVYDLAQFGDASADDLAFVSPPINNDGSIYEVRVQFVATGGGGGPYSAIETVAATSDPVGPDAATITSAAGGAGQITVAYTLPNSANCVGARIWRNATVGSLTGAVLFGTFYGSPGQSSSRAVTGYAAGTRFVIVEAINGSNVGGTIAAQSATVT